MDKISVVIPSMYRPVLLGQSLDSIFASRSSLYDLEIILVIDEDENSRNIAAFQLMDAKKYYDIDYQIDFGTERRGNIACWNIGTRLATGNLFLHWGDDSVLYSGALEKAYNAWVGMGRYGLVGLNDMIHHGDTVITTPLYDRQFCKDWLGGVMVVPHYKAFFADNEFHQRAKRSGKVVWLSDAIAEHRHSSNGKRELDEYEKTKPEHWPHDEELFHSREAAGFPNDFEPVI